MSRIGAIAIAFAAASVLAVLASATASAAPAEWMLNKKTLAEDGVTTAALRRTAVLDKQDVLTGGGLTIECSGGEAGVAPEIIKSTKGKAADLVAEGCKNVEPICAVPTTIGTVPVEFEATLDGSLAIKGIIRPQTGVVFTTLKITGAECVIAGNKPITGDLEVLAPEGQDERTDQLFETKQGATGLLKIGSSAAAAEGSVLLLLANSASWSFL